MYKKMYFIFEGHKVCSRLRILKYMSEREREREREEMQIVSIVTYLLLYGPDIT